MFNSKFFDIACALSLVGIWPRFVAPRRLKLTHQRVKIPRLKKNFTLLQFSDLHMNSTHPDRFLNKIIHQAKTLKPDLIVFTGDFLCRSRMEDGRLHSFLNAFSAPLGCYAVLGNHDYAKCIGINGKGEYDILTHTLARPQKLLGKTTPNALRPPFHDELLELLNGTPFKLLHNETVQINGVNLIGLGEYMAGHCNPQKAFAAHAKELPSIILLHNPDGIPLLNNYPRDLILCGHTHGAQINLPWLKNRLTPMENPQYKRGLAKDGAAFVYTNRGLGSISPTRVFSAPELTFFHLEGLK